MEQAKVLSLNRNPAEVARARRYVAQHCADVSSDVRSIAQLLTSEVVTNALEHGAGDIWLRLSRADRALRVEVTDPNTIPLVDPSSTAELTVAHNGSAAGVVSASDAEGDALTYSVKTGRRTACSPSRTPRIIRTRRATTSAPIASRSSWTTASAAPPITRSS